jgi:sulfite exporter TauE/SafE
MRVFITLFEMLELNTSEGANLWYLFGADTAMQLFVIAAIYIGITMPPRTAAPRVIETAASVIGCIAIGSLLAAIWPVSIVGSVAYVVYYQAT